MVLQRPRSKYSLKKVIFDVEDKEAMCADKIHSKSEGHTWSNQQTLALVTRTIDLALAADDGITGAKCEYHAERACPPEWLGPCVRTPKAGKLRHGTCASSSLSMANGLRCDSS